MAKHSALGASSAHRWMACPGSIRLSASIDSKSSVYAMEGTAAHELGEQCLRTRTSPHDQIGKIIPVEDEEFTVDDGMADAVETYVQTVLGDYNEKTDVLAIETRFSLEKLYPGMFGTNDASVYKPSDKKLIVYDYKHGQGHAVDVVDNPQLKYYALGACLLERHRPISEVELVIVQPRAPHKDGPVRRWSISAMDLMEWAGELVASAKATEADDAPVAAGDHCQFCAAAATCPELRSKALTAAKATFQAYPEGWTPPAPEGLTLEQLAAVMQRAELVKDWIRAVQEHAHQMAEHGHVIPGFKLVDKRATRKWRDEIGAQDYAIKHGCGASQVYAEPKTKSPAQLEKMIPKAAREGMAEFVSKESSGTNLVRDADTRPEVLSAVAKAFKPITIETGELPWEKT